jgi:hypothetical protein
MNADSCPLSRSCETRTNTAANFPGVPCKATLRRRRHQTLFISHLLCAAALIPKVGQWE